MSNAAKMKNAELGLPQTKDRTAARVPGALLGMLLLCLLMSGCRHRRVQAPPPPPPPPEMERPPLQPYAETAPSLHSKVLYSEVGIASWYGAPYHNARGADGRIYNQNAMTAAHRTLPLGSVVRVTNLATRQSTIVTITDRGPFVRGRILDLSRAAAIRIGVWRTGTARVRIDLLRSAGPFPTEGRWCVQIGAFHHDGPAKKLRDRLQREYPGANVIDFKGATGYWVRIKPDGESHRDAEEIARIVAPQEGHAYVVRLD
jgi:rare lipoprotein A